MATTSTERMRELVKRRKAGIVLPRCTECGAKCTSSKGIAQRLCSACRRQTPEGRKEAIENAYKSIYRREALKALQAKLEGFQWDWQEVEVRLPTHTQQVITETLRGARTIGICHPESGWTDIIDGTTLKVKRWAEIPKSEAS
jgi:hypothetical protein